MISKAAAHHGAVGSIITPEMCEDFCRIARKMRSKAGSDERADPAFDMIKTARGRQQPLSAPCQSYGELIRS